MVNPSTTKSDFGKLFLERFELLIQQQGVDQKQIADGTGLSPASIHKYRKKGALPGSEELSALADFFDVTTDWLLGRDQKVDYALREKPPDYLIDDVLAKIDNAKEELMSAQRLAQKMKVAPPRHSRISSDPQKDNIAASMAKRGIAAGDNPEVKPSFQKSPAEQIAEAVEEHVAESKRREKERKVR